MKIILDMLITSLSKIMPKFHTNTKVKSLILAFFDDSEEDWDNIKIGLTDDD
jgi:hypothetical protein